MTFFSLKLILPLSFIITIKKFSYKIVSPLLEIDNYLNVIKTISTYFDYSSELTNLYLL